MAKEPKGGYDVGSGLIGVVQIIIFKDYSLFKWPQVALQRRAGL